MERNRMLSVALLALIASTSLAGAEEPPIVFADSPAYERMYQEAGNSEDPHAWLSRVREGMASAAARWEKSALEIYGDPMDLANARAELGVWLDEDLERRFSEWLQDRFFGRQAALLRAAVGLRMEGANKEFLFMCGEDGSPLSDAAGDIALIRPLEGRSVSEDSALWRHRVDGAIDEALMGMAGIMACVRPELLSFVPEGRRESYARLFMECLSDARDRTRLELEALARREERSFVARRTADMNSLKRKSDATSASAIADELSAGAVEACASGIAALNAHIEAARGNPEELNLAGQAWLEEFERQFQRGMASWQAAEERFMARRLEWELDSISSFRAGEEEWSRAFGRLEKERSAWETRLYAQLEEGEKAFAKAHGDLESSIRTARSEFERDSMQRRSVSVEKAQAWASVYIQSAAAAANARESVDYWLLELGGIRPEGDYTDLKAWLKAGMEDDPPGSQAGKAREEALRWLDLLGSCTSRAKEAAEALFQCFGVAIGDDVSSLRVFMDVGADPGAFKLDEYQVELFRAKAVQGYWERRVTIAEAVASYASELGAARLTEAEVILELEWASSLYAAALSDYRELVEELGAMSEKEREKREELAGKASLLKKAGTALQEINARYSRALGALSLSGAGYLLDEALRKYRELLECSVFSEGSLPPGQAASMALYLERGAAYGIETTMASAEDSMKSALEGEDGEPSLRELKARYDSVWAGAEGEEIPGDIAGFGVEGDPVARRTLQALLSLAETSESEAFSLGISEALRAAARSAKERARLRLEARLDGISLLANGSPESWYLERSGRPCAEDLPWERYLEGQASESARCAALAKALLERDALLAVLGPEASATLPAEATFTLEAWWKGTKEEARRGVDALDAYISILEGMAGRDIHDFTESLSLLHATNERAYAYALGEGFFMLGDIDLSALLEGPDMARAVRDCGLLEAFRRWSSTALSFEKNRQDTILDSLKNAFSLAGLGGLIEVDTTMPSVREIGEALAMTEPGFSETAMALARAVGEASARVPVWLGDILNRWAKRFLDYCAAKCLYDGLVETRNLDQILRELDELDQRIRHAREEGTPIAAELEADRIKLLGERDFSSRVQSLRDAEEAARESGKKHWRESILAPDFSENASGLVLPGDPEGPAACGMRAAASWYEGLLADLAYDLHACGELFSSALAAWRGTGQGLEDMAFSLRAAAAKIVADRDGDASSLMLDASERGSREAFELALGEWNARDARRVGLADCMAALLSSYEECSDRDTLEERVASLARSLAEAQEANALAAQEYQACAASYAELGAGYDRLFSRVQSAYEAQESARTEMEKWDAVTRWASSVYLGMESSPDAGTAGDGAYRGPEEESAYASAKLERARAALSALEGLYDESIARRPYADGERSELCEAYRSSYRAMLLSAKARDALRLSLEREHARRDACLDDLKSAMMGGPGNPVFVLAPSYEGYAPPGVESEERWRDMIGIGGNGMLALSYDSSFRLKCLETESAETLEAYFNDASAGDGRLSAFQLDLAAWSSRFAGYRLEGERLQRWALARDYLMAKLVQANPSRPALASASPRLADYLYGQARYTSMYYMTVAERMDIFRQPRHITIQIGQNGSFDTGIGMLSKMREDAWMGLGEQERADLEFLVGMCLAGVSGMDEINEAMSDGSRLAECRYVKQLFDYGIQRTEGSWWIPDMIRNRDWKADRNRYVNPCFADALSSVIRGSSSLAKATASISAAFDGYSRAGALLSGLEGRPSDELPISWDVILDSLRVTGCFSDSEMLELRALFAYRGDGAIAAGGALEALEALHNLEKATLKESRSAYELSYQEDQIERRRNEVAYCDAYAAFMNGNSPLEILEEKARKSFGEESASLGVHLDSMASALEELLLDGISMRAEQAMETSEAITEYLGLIARAEDARHAGLLAAREGEWALLRKEARDKHDLWMDSAALILSRGREDYKRAALGMRERYGRWRESFVAVYDERRAAWSFAAMDFFVRKQAWAGRAADAASERAGEAILALVGNEPDAIGRRLDVFAVGSEYGKTGAEDSLDRIMEETGLETLHVALGSFSRSVACLPSEVRRGAGAVSAWDFALVGSAASAFASENAALVAAQHSRVVAGRVREAAMRAASALALNVDSANRAFSRKMDERFMREGGWTRQGESYEKEILAHSTLFRSRITETATLRAYREYHAEAWLPETDLSDDRLAGLDSLAIFRLLERAQDEIRAKGEEIFAEDTGSFCAHIGEAPTLKAAPDMEDGVDGIVSDPGQGELGRLLRYYLYWGLVESQGLAELGKPVYEKDLWDDRGSWFQAPSLRGLADLGVGIAAAAFSGGTSFAALAVCAGANLVDDAVFGSLDIALGYKSVEEAGMAFGKKALESAVNIGARGLFGGLSAAGLEGLEGLSGWRSVAGHAVVSGLETGFSGFASSAVQALYWDGEGIAWSAEAFGAGLRANLTGAAAGLASSAVSGCLNLGLEGFTGRVYADGNALNAFAGAAAGQAVRYSLGGDMGFNVFNLGILGIEGGSGIVTGGLLELSVGRDGVGMRIGSGGMDLSIGTVARAIGGLESWAVNARMALSGQDAAYRYASALRTLYSVNEGKGDERVLFEQLLEGSARIALDPEADYRAKTESKLSGIGDPVIREITLGREAFESGQRFGLNVLLVHEAYRNGLDDGALGQALETERALLGHIGAAAELGAAYGLGALGGELAGELLALSLAGGGDYGALSRVLARYDCSDDYWKLTKEGVLLNDGKARLLVEYCTDDGDPSWREVEGSEGEGSVSAALVRYLGADRALGLLGGSVNDFSLYDDQTLRDVLNLDDQDIKAMRRNPAEAARAVMQATALQREKLVGEALMKGAGIVWMDGRDGSATVGWLGAGAGIALTDGQIRGMAAIRSIGPGLYERYSITAELERREGAYQAWINGQKGDLGDGNTRLSFTKWDIDTGEAIGTIVAGGAWNSVDNCYGQVVNGQAIGVDNRYQILGGPLVQGSTIARGPLSMRWSLDGSNPDWGDVMILANTYTIAGEPILADGRGGWRRDNDRWLLHMTKNGSSEGCFVSMASDDAKKDLFMYLKSWGLYQGYSIDSYLYDNNDFAYRYSYKKGRW